MAEILVMGMALADVMIRGLTRENYSDEIQMAEEIQILPGGDAFNEAVIASRLGNRVRLLASVGADDAGELIRAKAQAAGVDVRGLVRDPQVPTRIMVLTVDENGERRQIARRPGPKKVQAPALSEIRGAKIVSFASLFRAPWDEKGALLAAASRAKEQGAIVCADIKTNDGSMTLADFGEALSYIDYIFPNEAEARFHTGKETPEEMGQALLDLGFGHVVIKLGSRGCYACSREESFYMRSFLVKALDSTGAGDNFAAGFMTALGAGMSFNRCCRFASAVAAVSVQAFGATAGVESRKQVEEFMERRRAILPVVGKVTE